MQRLTAILMGAVPVLAAATNGPISGVPFLQPEPLQKLKAGEDLNEKITQLSFKAVTQKTGAAHSCDDGKQADKNRCLSVPNRKCMWVRMESFAAVGATTEESYCMPCELDGEKLPCYSQGSTIGSMKVANCEMSCLHQSEVIHPESACSGSGGGDSEASCLARGASIGVKCMFISFAAKDGSSKGSCSPCSMAGVGMWGCPAKGATGPEANSSVTGCISQCELEELPNGKAIPTAAPTSPGAIRVSAPANAMMSAPYGIPEKSVAAPTKAPALAVASPAPKRDFPVVVVAPPEDYAATTVEPLPAAPAQWPVQLPKSLVETNMLRGSRTDAHA